MANTKVPAHLSTGLALDDLSNVTPATGRDALGVHIPTSTVGLGFWDAITGATANTAVPLPAGGTWAWFGFYLSATGAMSGVAGGVDPGETEVLPAVADLIGSVLCWRVA